MFIIKLAKPRMIKMLNWIYWLERIIRLLARVQLRNKLRTIPIYLGQMGYQEGCRPRPRLLVSIRDILYSIIPFFIPDHVETFDYFENKIPTHTDATHAISKSERNFQNRFPRELDQNFDIHRTSIIHRGLRKFHTL